MQDIMQPRLPRHFTLLKAVSAADKLLCITNALVTSNAIDGFSTTAVKTFVFLSSKRREKGDSEGDL